MSIHPARASSNPDVLGHLVYAITVTQPAVIMSTRGEFDCRLTQTDGREVTLALIAADQRVTVGELICLEYGPVVQRFRFYAEVLRIGEDAVTLDAPLAVECSDKRRTPRIPAPEGSAFYADEGGVTLRLGIGNLSVGGASLQEETVSHAIGDQLAGTLVLGELRIACVLEVRHVQLRRGRVWIGCRFDQMSLRNRGRLATALADLDQPDA